MRRSYLLLAALVLGVFGAALWAPFQYDDYSLLSADGIWLPMQTRPLTYLTFWANRAVGGENPAGYHAVNLALHLAAVLLLYAVASRLVEERAALIAALVFAVHPVQVEPVAYIFARGTVLAALLCLGSLFAWVRGRDWLAVGWFALALAAKEECAAFPLFLLLVRRGNLRAIAAMLALAAGAAGWVAYASAATAGSGAGAQAGISPVDYFLTQGTVWVRYLRLLVFPVGLSVDPAIEVAGWKMGSFCWIALLAAIGFVLRKGRESGWWWVGIGFVLSIPTSSVFPAADLAADRRLYLPMISISIGIGVLLVKYWTRATVPVLVLVLGALSFQRVQVWGSQERLWADAAAKAPEKLRPKLWLLRVREDPGVLPNELRRLAPDDPAVSNELGRVYLERGRYQEALEEFGRAAAQAPRSPIGYSNRGVALEAMGLREAAVESFRQALEVDPCFVEARRNLERLGETAGAAPTGCGP